MFEPVQKTSIMDTVAAATRRQQPASAELSFQTYPAIPSAFLQVILIGYGHFANLVVLDLTAHHIYFLYFLFRDIFKLLLFASAEPWVVFLVALFYVFLVLLQIFHLRTINYQKLRFSFVIIIQSIFQMKRYGNISKYLANSSQLLAENTQNQRNYDVIPTNRRNLAERHFTQQPQTSPVSYNQGLPRADTTQTQPFFQNNKRQWNGPREQNSHYENQREEQVSQRSRISQRVLNERSRREVISSQRYGKEILNQAEWRREMKNSISKLREIKANLEIQIKALQKILDQSSKNIDNMEKQFQSIKLRILEYTSQCLDNAFISYRNSMPRWSKYQQVQKKGLQLIVELSEYIAGEEGTVARVESKRAEINFTNSLKQVVNRIAHYGNMTQQISKVKKECVEKHPTLQEDRIAQFQNSLHLLCAF